MSKEKTKRKKERLWAQDEFGELFLEVSQIIWIQRSDRKTFAKTSSKEYLLRENISELEEKLDAYRFVRVNRGVIVNLSYLLNYSFWENDKYVVRIKGYSKEFIMSRQRLNKVKDRLLEAHY